jgi:hypothetical protein
MFPTRMMLVRRCRAVAYCHKRARAGHETAVGCTRLSELAERLTLAPLIVERLCNNAPRLMNAKDQAPS